MKIIPQRCAQSIFVAAGLSLLVSAANANTPPATPVKPVVDNYFGHQITDDYRWLEDLSSPETVAWFKAQSVYTNNQLAAIPGSKSLLTQVKSLDGSVTTYSEVNRVGTRIFYEKFRPTDQAPKLYVRDGLHGTERLLIDPESYATASVHYAIDYYVPSLDGKHVAVGISRGGSENSVIIVIDADSGKLSSDKIDRARFGSPSWLPDGKSFFYNRLPKLLPTDDPSLAEEKSKVYLHVLGNDPDTDPAVFGYGVSPETNSYIEPEAISTVGVTPASPYAVAVVEHGVQNELTIFSAPVADVVSGVFHWTKVADTPDDVTGYDIKGSTIYLVTHKDASRFKVITTSLINPDLNDAKIIVPPSRMVVQGVIVAKDGLYITNLDGGIGKLRKVGFGGGIITNVELPYKGTIAELSSDPRLSGLWMLLTGWTESALWYSYDPVTGKLTDTGLKKKSPADFSGIQALEVSAPAADGTLIPLSIVIPKNYKLDGSHPALVEAYGSYGVSMNPGFDPTLLAWFKHGGIYAMAHVRGGGEYGEDWHDAGKLLTKPNTWNDLIACCEYLIKKGYTSPKKLAIEGGSAGGITVGRALTERPDLFAAVLDDVGASDALRQQFSPNGPANMPEFGDVTTPEGFKALYAMDAYQHVEPRVKYPAVLLTTGINDPRVAPWEPAKMAAKLQASTISGRPVLLRVDYDAGHGIGSDRSQSDQLLADEWSFALWQLGVPGFQVSVK